MAAKSFQFLLSCLFSLPLSFPLQHSYLSRLVSFSVVPSTWLWPLVSLGSLAACSSVPCISSHLELRSGGLNQFKFNFHSTSILKHKMKRQPAEQCVVCANACVCECACVWGLFSPAFGHLPEATIVPWSQVPFKVTKLLQGYLSRNKHKLYPFSLDSILQSRDITLLTKLCLVKALVSPVVMYGCESWTIKKAEC